MRGGLQVILGSYTVRFFVAGIRCKWWYVSSKGVNLCTFSPTMLTVLCLQMRIRWISAQLPHRQKQVRM